MDTVNQVLQRSTNSLVYFFSLGQQRISLKNFRKLLAWRMLITNFFLYLFIK